MGESDWRLNATFIALILKVRDATHQSCQYGCQGFSKQTRSQLGDLTEQTQGTFIKGRQIMEGVLIANEFVVSRKHEG